MSILGDPTRRCWRHDYCFGCTGPGVMSTHIIFAQNVHANKITLSTSGLISQMSWIGDQNRNLIGVFLVLTGTWRHILELLSGCMQLNELPIKCWLFHPTSLCIQLFIRNRTFKCTKCHAFCLQVQDYTVAIYALNALPALINEQLLRAEDLLPSWGRRDEAIVCWWR